MKKISASFTFLLLSIMSMSGCQAVGDKSASLSIVYVAAAVLSLLLLVGCCVMVPPKKVWFVSLFSSVLVVNIGYTMLAFSSGLEMALMANRIAYLGSVFLPFFMLMIILDATNTKYSNRLHIILGIIAIIVFLVAASPGILDIYYKQVSFAVINGVSTLNKVYGPLHPLYLFYLLSYLATMIVIIIRAQVKKTIDTTAHAVILIIAVIVNISVWLIEQLVSIEFEMLSISYIISELFLLGVHLVMNENKKLKEIANQVKTLREFSEVENCADAMRENPVVNEGIDTARIEVYINGLDRLTATEKTIYDAYIARVTTKEIMANLNIKENTLKYHNKNIYSKLGVSSRKELLEIYKQMKIAKANLK